MAYCFSGVSWAHMYNPGFRWGDFEREETYPEFKLGLKATRENNPDFFVSNMSAILTTTHKALHDVFHVGANLVVSERFHDLIEEFEPGIHQFIQLQIYDVKSLKIDRNFYLMNILTRLNGIDYEASSFSKLQDGENIIYTSSFNKTWLLKRSVVFGHFIWMDEFSSFDIYMSDDLYTKYKKLKLKGLGDVKFCEEI